MTRTVLGFSGSLRTSAAIPWLIERQGGEVVTVTLDFGQGEELAAVREQALALGAVRAHVIDVREEFVSHYLLAALRAGALMDAHALIRPLVGKRLADVARMETAAAIAYCAEPGSEAHTAIGSAIRALAPSIDVIVPDIATGAELEAFARERGVHLPPPPPVRVRASVWGRSLTSEGQALIAEEAFTLTRELAECPQDAALVDVEFVEGSPVAANGIEMPMIELIESLETIAGAHGIGRTIAGNQAFESPAAQVLAIAQHALENHLLAPEVLRVKRQLAAAYSEAVLNGRWFSDLREGIDAFATVSGKRISGIVRLALLHGECRVLACEPRADRAASSAPRPQAVA